jgi:hypothetical protein
MLGKQGQVAQNEFIWISDLKEVELVGIGRHATNNFGISIVKLCMSTEFLSLSLVSVCVRHISNRYVRWCLKFYLNLNYNLFEFE